MIILILFSLTTAFQMSIISQILGVHGVLETELLKSSYHVFNFTCFMSSYRDDEIIKLSSDIGKQPKLAPRRSYIEQINEITKNSRKQDTDIQLILKDIRELQLESNTIQERLNRTFAVLEETILRSNLLNCWFFSLLYQA